MNLGRKAGRSSIVAALLSIPMFAFSQTTLNMPDVILNDVRLRGIEIASGPMGTVSTMVASIEPPRGSDWAKGLQLVFAVSGAGDGDIQCGIYEAVLTTQPEGRVTIPVHILAPGGRCKPATLQAVTREAAEAARRAAYVSQSPRLFNGFEEIFISADRKCAQQFIEAQSMEGLEKRKRLAELLQYGCGFSVISGTRVDVLRTMEGFAEVFILTDLSAVSRSPASAQKSGWVPVAWVKADRVAALGEERRDK